MTYAKGYKYPSFHPCCRIKQINNLKEFYLYQHKYKNTFKSKWHKDKNYKFRYITLEYKLIISEFFYKYYFDKIYPKSETEEIVIATVKYSKNIKLIFELAKEYGYDFNPITIVENKNIKLSELTEDQIDTLTKWQLIACNCDYLTIVKPTDKFLAIKKLDSL